MGRSSGSWFQVSCLTSKEGVTQGDPLSMFIFAVCSLIWSLNSIEVTQVWYADDASSVGSFDALKEWFDLIKKNGPCFGYFPKPLKSFLVVDERSLTNYLLIQKST